MHYRLAYIVSAKVGGSTLLDEAAKRTMGVDGVVAVLPKAVAHQGGVCFSVLAGASASGAAIELVFRRITKRRAFYATERAGIRIDSSHASSRSFSTTGASSRSSSACCIGTTFPMVSEAMWNEKVSVGPPVFNAWVQPLGAVHLLPHGRGYALRLEEDERRCS